MLAARGRPGGAIRSARPCTPRCARTWSRCSVRRTLWGACCRGTSPWDSSATWIAASWPAALPACGATRAATELLVAFSCKGRGVCSSWIAKRALPAPRAGRTGYSRRDSRGPVRRCCYRALPGPACAAGTHGQECCMDRRRARTWRPRWRWRCARGARRRECKAGRNSSYDEDRAVNCERVLGRLRFRSTLSRRSMQSTRSASLSDG